MGCYCCCQYRMARYFYYAIAADAVKLIRSYLYCPQALCFKICSAPPDSLNYKIKMPTMAFTYILKVIRKSKKIIITHPASPSQSIKKWVSYRDNPERSSIGSKKYQYYLLILIMGHLYRKSTASPSASCFLATLGRGL